MESVAEPRFTITLDGDPSISAQIAAATGFESKWLQSTDELNPAQLPHPLAVFLDVNLSIETSASGQLIPKLKDYWPLSPIILTTLVSESDLLTEAMALGADDFLLKPLAAADLQQRYQVRKAALALRAARETLVVGDMTIDTLQRSVTTERGQCFLSPTEVKLLAELAKSRGNVVPRELLKSRCWPQMAVSDNALNRKLYEIRRRLKPLTERIQIRTIYGIGFVMEET